jgi:hypothetical protein
MHGHDQTAPMRLEIDSFSPTLHFVYDKVLEQSGSGINEDTSLE